jgi:hypothetical protein
LIRTKEEYRFGKKAASALAVFVLLLAFAAFFAGSNVVGRTETIADTTVTKTVNFTATTTALSTTLQYVTITSTGYTTAYYLGPDDVLVSGSASSSAPTTTADQVVFQNSANQTFIAQVAAGGAYSISLPNHAFYSVFIKYSTPVGVGGGQCTAGGLVLFYTGASITASFRC